MEKSDVVVVGGGIIGAFCCYYLAEDGFDVTWVTGQDPRSSAAWGSAGYIAVGLGTPLPSYGSLVNLAKWALARDSPLKINLSFAMLNASWLVSYIKSRRRMMEVEAIRLIRTMGFESLAALQELASSGEIDVELSRKGALVVYSSSTELENHLKQLEDLRELDIDYMALTGEECIREEPQLSDRVAGGVLYREDAWVNPSKLLLQLRELVSRLGVRVVNDWASKVVVTDGEVQSIGIKGTELGADEYVFALGSKTRRFLSSLGIGTPIAPAWGYTGTLEPVGWRLKRPTMIGEHRLATSQTLDGHLRLSGFFELASVSFMPPESRFKWLRDKATKVLPGLKGLRIIDEWSGMRPCTPDGLPIIGRLSTHNRVILAVGHCREGLTLAAATGRMVRDITREGVRDPHPLLSPSRFGL